MAESPRHLLGPFALSTAAEIKPLRSSNDYFPDIPSSHTYHVYTNILASQFLSAFTIPDFDMFQTHPFTGSSAAVAPQGPFHASMRALGHGPVTVTDVPGKSDATVYMRVCGRGRDGVTMALNGETPIEVADERCFDEVSRGGDGSGLRGYSRSEWGVVMGIWNVRDNGGWVKDSFSLGDVAHFFSGKKRIACWDHLRGEACILSAEETVEIELKELEFGVFTCVEVGSGVACFGLVDKFNSLAGIHSRVGGLWNFKVLGEAMWVIDGEHVATVKVEGEAVSCVCWVVGDVTFVRGSLTDYKDDGHSVGKNFWQVEVSY
jgi:Raffinose synthase or seed imbibition protein Sip1